MRVITDRIGIIGGSELGFALARTLARAGIEPVLASGDWDQCGGLGADASGSAAAATPAKAAEQEIVLLTPPWLQVAEVLSAIPDWEGRILVDATDPISAELAAADLHGRTSSEVVSEFAPGAQLVKAFNTLPPRIIEADPRQAGGRRVIFFCGDHVRAKREVAGLIARLGFAGVDLGSLVGGGKLQCADGPFGGLNLIRIE
jgi:predicted dinucleotide-binding enzyme